MFILSFACLLGKRNISTLGDFFFKDAFVCTCMYSCTCMHTREHVRLPGAGGCEPVYTGSLEEQSVYS